MSMSAFSTKFENADWWGVRIYIYICIIISKYIDALLGSWRNPKKMNNKQSKRRRFVFSSQCVWLGRSGIPNWLSPNSQITSNWVSVWFHCLYWACLNVNPSKDGTEIPKFWFQCFWDRNETIHPSKFTGYPNLNANFQNGNALILWITSIWCL